jgi:hypothetical protein
MSSKNLKLINIKSMNNHLSLFELLKYGQTQNIKIGMTSEELVAIVGTPKDHIELDNNNGITKDMLQYSVDRFDFDYDNKLTSYYFNLNQYYSDYDDNLMVEYYSVFTDALEILNYTISDWLLFFERNGYVLKESHINNLQKDYNVIFIEYQVLNSPECKNAFNIQFLIDYINERMYVLGFTTLYNGMNVNDLKEIPKFSYPLDKFRVELNS